MNNSDQPIFFESTFLANYQRISTKTQLFAYKKCNLAIRKTDSKTVAYQVLSKFTPLINCQVLEYLHTWKSACICSKNGILQLFDIIEESDKIIVIVEYNDSYLTLNQYKDDYLNFKYESNIQKEKKVQQILIKLINIIQKCYDNNIRVRRLCCDIILVDPETQEIKISGLSDEPFVAVDKKPYYINEFFDLKKLTHKLLESVFADEKGRSNPEFEKHISSDCKSFLRLDNNAKFLDFKQHPFLTLQPSWECLLA